jgi:hypothetical protein
MKLSKEFMRSRSTTRSRNKPLKTRFRADTRFEVSPAPSVPPRGPAEGDLDRLKERLVRPLLNTAHEPELNSALQLAANEAASAAWFTPYPLLVFPALLEEKLAGARRQQARQRVIRVQTQGLLEEAISE